MLIQPGALQPVPTYAVVPESVVLGVLRRFTSGKAMQPRLDAAFRTLEREQPALAEFLGAELSEIEAPEAQALGYFLFLAVFSAFRESFGSRLCAVGSDDLESVVDRLLADGDARSQAAPAETYSEDVIALGQPALMRLVRAEIEEQVAGDQAGPILQALLVEIVALTSAVAPLS